MRPPPLTVTESRNPSVMKVTDLLDLHRFRIDSGPWRVRNPIRLRWRVAAYEGVNAFEAVQ